MTWRVKFARPAARGLAAAASDAADAAEADTPGAAASIFPSRLATKPAVLTALNDTAANVTGTATDKQPEAWTSPGAS
jgi:hypothetical protein